ncbi:MAG: CoA transferase, partial [Pseudomonadota bacterium]
VLTGFCACISLGAALIQRRLRGRTDVARASLAAAGNLIQAQFMYDYSGRAPFDEPSGREVKGWGPFYACYSASDQWLFLAAPDEGRAVLERVPEFSGLGDLDDDGLVSALSERFAQEPFAHWTAAIPSGSTTVMALGSLHATRDDAIQLDHNEHIDIAKATFRAVRHTKHPMGRWVDLVAPNAVRPANAAITIPGPAPKYGADTVKVLTQLGYGPNEIEALIGEGHAGTSWSDKYLPE